MLYTLLMLILFVLVLHAVLTLSCYGWGRGVLKLLSLASHTLPRTLAVWTGWMSLLVLWQVLHLVLPLTVWVVVPTLFIGIILAVIRRQERASRPVLSPLIAVSVLLLFVLRLVAIARALQSPTNYDTGLYHLQVLQWYNRYTLVPGLGNLHGRLAFNPSYFVFVAGLNFAPWFGQGRVLANSFLLMLSAGTMLELLYPVLRDPAGWKRAHPFTYAAPLLVLPMLIYLGLRSSDLSSPTPDFASHVLQLVLFALLCYGLGRWLDGDRELDALVGLMVLLTVTAITVKLSNAVFALVMVAFVAAYLLKTRKHTLLYRLLACAVLITGVWCLRGYVLSGAPLYPSTLGWLPLEWAVPKSAAIEDARAIYAWARMPGRPADLVPGTWAWFGPWLARLMTFRLQVLYPVLLSVILAAGALGIRLASRNIRATRLEWALWLPVLMGLVYWFFTAPDTRFALALFYLLPVTGALLCCAALRDWLDRTPLLAILSGGILLGSLVLLAVFGASSLRSTPGNWITVDEVHVETRVTDSGLEVNVPLVRDQCWNAPLPCTPYFRPALRLRVPGELGKGFVVK